MCCGARVWPHSAADLHGLPADTKTDTKDVNVGHTGVQELPAVMGGGLPPPEKMREDFIGSEIKPFTGEGAVRGSSSTSTHGDVDARKGAEPKVPNPPYAKYGPS